MSSAGLIVDGVKAPFWTRRPELALQITFALVLAASAVELFRLISVSGPVLVYIAIAVGVVGRAALRPAPKVGLALGAISPLLAGVAGWDPTVEYSVAVFILFSFALRERGVLTATVVIAAATYGAVTIESHAFYGVEPLATISSSVAAGALAAVVRSQQQYWGALQQRAADAVATRDLEATRRVAEERVRIARDLHDIVGHQVAVLSVQLGAIEVSTGKQTPESRKAFEVARQSVQSILQETQQILYVLRTDRHGDNQTDLTPSPGVADIDDLIESYRQIGLEVTASVVQTPIGIDPGIDVTAYRIVQEALTNAQRYGDGHANVTVSLHDGRLTIDVSNALSASNAPRRLSPGFGLVGMRERVTSVGGTLDVQPDGHDFAVHVVLNVSGDPLT